MIDAGIEVLVFLKNSDELLLRYTIKNGIYGRDEPKINDIKEKVDIDLFIYAVTTLSDEEKDKMNNIREVERKRLHTILGDNYINYNGNRKQN